MGGELGLAAQDSTAKGDTTPLVEIVPGVYRTTGTGEIVVQGCVVTPKQANIEVPAGEQLVEIPMELLGRAAGALGLAQAPEQTPET